MSEELTFFTENVDALRAGDLEKNKETELRVSNGLGILHQLSKAELTTQLGREPKVESAQPQRGV